MEFNFSPLGWIGLVVMIFGGMALDGDINIAINIFVIGVICFAVDLIREHRRQKRIEENRMRRMIERERRESL